MSEQTPRISAQYLEQFTHQTIRILGKVTQLRGETATIDSNGEVVVHLNRVSVPVQGLSGGIHTRRSVAMREPEAPELMQKPIGSTSENRSRGRDHRKGSGGSQRQGVDEHGFRRGHW